MYFVLSVILTCFFFFSKKASLFFLYVCYMEFRTVVPCEKLQQQISHRDEILLLGSCFAENIGRLLVSHKFNVGITLRVFYIIRILLPMCWIYW